MLVDLSTCTGRSSILHEKRPLPGAPNEVGEGYTLAKRIPDAVRSHQRNCRIFSQQ